MTNEYYSSDIFNNYEIRGNWLRFVDSKGNRQGLHFKNIREWWTRPAKKYGGPEDRIVLWFNDGMYGISVTELDLEVLINKLEAFL